MKIGKDILEGNLAVCIKFLIYTYIPLDPEILLLVIYLKKCSYMYVSVKYSIEVLWILRQEMLALVSVPPITNHVTPVQKNHFILIFFSLLLYKRWITICLICLRGLTLRMWLPKCGSWTNIIASSRNLLEIQILQLQLRPIESETLGMWAAISILISCLGDSETSLNSKMKTYKISWIATEGNWKSTSTTITN